MRMLQLSKSQLRSLVRRSLVLEAKRANTSRNNQSASPLADLSQSTQLLNTTLSAASAIIPGNRRETPWRELFPDMPENVINNIYNETGRGTGRGEKLLARLFNVVPRSNPYGTYDLDIGNERWEVKEASGTVITFGTIGDEQCMSYLKELSQICDQIDKYLSRDKIDKFPAFPAIRDSVYRGEVGKRALKDLKVIVETIHAETNPRQNNSLTINKFKYDITFSGKDNIYTNEIAPTPMQSRMLSKVLGDDNFADKSAELLHDVFNSISSTAKWFDEQEEKLYASSVCRGKIDGILLVSNNGVRSVPTDKLDKFMSFASITRHSLRYDVSPALRN
jgi:hypothetical protein